MCPYYNESGMYCKIYKTAQNSSNEQDYCKEGRCSYTECPNYKQLCKVYNGNPPASHNY